MVRGGSLSKHSVTRSLVASALLLSLVSACGGEPPLPPPEPQTTLVSTASAQPTEPTSSPSESSPSASPTSTEFEEQTEDPTEEPSTKPTLGPEDAGRDLKVADVHSVEPSGTELKDDIFKVGSSDAQGMGVKVEQCGDSEPVTIELRLGLAFKTLRFEFGQELNATEDSDQTLIARVEGDDEDFIKSAKATLKNRNSVEADVGDVAAAKIKLYLDDTKCDYNSSVYAVLIGLKVE